MRKKYIKKRLDLSLFNNFEDENEEITESFLKNDFIKYIYNELNKSDDSEWASVEIKSLLQLAFQLLIALLSSYVNENGNYLNRNLSLIWLFNHISVK